MAWGTGTMEVLDNAVASIDWKKKYFLLETWSLAKTSE